jgi:hypothetical protein
MRESGGFALACWWPKTHSRTSGGDLRRSALAPLTSSTPVCTLVPPSANFRTLVPHGPCSVNARQGHPGLLSQWFQHANKEICGAEPVACGPYPDIVTAIGSDPKGTAPPYATGGGGTVLEHPYGAVLLTGLLTSDAVPALREDAACKLVFPRLRTCLGCMALRSPTGTGQQPSRSERPPTLDAASRATPSIPERQAVVPQRFPPHFIRPK